MSPTDAGPTTPDVPASAEERKLRECLYALNVALPDESTRIPDDAPEHVRRLVRIRDEVFALGADLYKWED